MQAQAFVRKWGPGGSANDLNERAGAQAHFIDLCRVLGVPEPDDPDHLLRDLPFPRRPHPRRHRAPAHRSARRWRPDPGRPAPPLFVSMLRPSPAPEIERIVQHLVAHEVDDVEGRLGEIFDALELLIRHPLIGRPVAGGRRELAIGQGSHGYVARYRYDRLDDEIVVMALRAQREVGFEER